MNKKIFLTNDDGIESPALWETARALQSLGDVTIVAPKVQQSGTGRSMPKTSPATIFKVPNWAGFEGQAYSIDASPAQAVQYGVLEIMGENPDLLVSGVNYGNNFSYSVTASGTLGATLEAAAIGIPSIALSMETAFHEFYTNSDLIDFSKAAVVTRRIAEYFFANGMPAQTDILKVEMASDVEENTPFKFVPLSPERFYEVGRPDRTPAQWEEPFHAMKFGLAMPPEKHPENTDVYTTLVERLVAVTPLRFDMSAPVDYGLLNQNQV